MINKRSFGDEGSFEVACKHPRHLEHYNEPAPYVDVFHFSDASQKFQTPDGKGDWSCKFQEEGRSAAARDMATEVTNETYKELETGASGSMAKYLWVNNSIVEANVRSESEAHLSLFPEFFGPVNQLRDIHHSDKICSSPVDYSPHNLVSVGPEHQAYVPDWGHEGSHTSDNPANLDFQHERPLGVDEEKLMGSCVLSMPDLEASANFFCEDVGARDNCMCADSGSVRCVRQHITDAREKLREDLGQELFEELGFCDMGEEVADKWSEEEEHLFHDVVLSNPASLGKNFWHNLSVAFPSRTHKDVVSYYFNVFMLRRRAEQNRFDPLNTDSDDDELQKSEFGLVEDNEEPVVVSPINLDASAYNEEDHLRGAQEYIEDADDIDGYDDAAVVGCKGINQGLAWFVMSFSALHCKFKAAEKFPLLLRGWWAVSFVLCLCTLYVDGRGFVQEGSIHLHSHVVANFAVTPALAFLCFVAIRGVTGVIVCRNSELQEPLLEEEAGCLKVTPYSDAGIFSLATLSWINPLLSIGAKRPLEIKDIPLLAPQDRAKTNYKVLNSNWEKLKAAEPSKQPSLAWAILKSFWKEAACNAIFAGLNTLVSYVGPYMISYFVDYLGGIETFPHEGYILAGTFFAAKLVETLTTRQWYLGVDILGMHVRSALTAMVYRKGLRLSSSAKQSHTSGEIVNYMAVDVQRIGDYSWYLHDIWMLPLQIVLALAILYKNVGIASVATLIATIISIVLTVPLAKIQEDYQDKLMTAKDERMRKTSECLRNMRILKLQAWEDRYRLMLEEMRSVEFKYLRKALYSQAFITFMFWSSPIFVSAVTFGTSIFLGTRLTAGGVLSALATFRILQEPLRNFPDLVSMMAQTKVSLDRISGFLQEEELQADATIVLPRGITSTSIEIKDGVFSWDPSSARPTLSGIQMKVERGMRVAVCGMVGSGKSSFLSCILGEIPKISGEVKLCGTAAYVSQSAWIQSGNIEENILFGSPMEKPKYKKVIHACSLKKDLELFSHGDQTIIGDRGINLSGGQKQRVQLARALYQDADIYLLDDPFSAVDAHTGSELFKEYILTALEDKTVVFVTHQVEFLPSADLILVLKEGRIIQAGKYDDLLQAGTDFKTLVSAHHDAIEAMDIPNYSSGDSDLNLCPDGSVGLGKNPDLPSSSVDCLAKEVQEGPSASEQKAIKEKKKAKRARKKQLVQEEERVRGRVSMKVYLSYMAAAYKGSLIPLIIIAQAIFQFLQIASSWWMAWANPQTQGDQPKVSAMVLLGVYMALAFGSSWFIFVRAVLVATFGLEAAQKLFLKMLRSVFRAPMSFFDSTPAGRILNRVSIDQSVVDLDIPFRLGGFASTTIQLIGIVGVMTKVTWQVLLLVVPMAIACLWMQKYYMASSRELVRIVSIQKSPIIHLFGESIAGAATIRGFGQEKRFMKRNLYFLDCFARPFFCSIAAIEWLCLRMELLSTFVFAFCMLLLVSFPHGTIDPSMAGLAVTYGLNLNARLSRWILSFCKLENKIISIERIYQYSQIPSEAPPVIEDSRPPTRWPENGTIELHDLKVRYKENLPVVLHGVTCTFPGGMNIGIVGRTGSGKSTLIQALFRLIEPAAGRILIDKIDISTLGLHDLRSRLSIIPQDPTLFEGTIRGNLDPLQEHSDHEVWQALDKSQLGDVIRKTEHKLDSPVLENGDNWSVGQRQLVSLGRALLKQAKILVLDEATASVDTQTDNLIQKIIRTEFKNCTVCTIAHRIPTVIDSDLVLVLSDGRVAEFDTPQRLLEDKSSMFLKLVTEYSSRSSGIPDF